MKIIAILILTLATHFAKAQSVRVAFWNVENLYDTINQPTIADNEFTPQGKQKWTSQKYNDKTTLIRKAIAELNADVLGICEVENRNVVEDILIDGYDYIHFDSPDIRGIDVALIYKSSAVKIINAQSIKATGEQRTRDLLRVDAEVEGRQMTFVVAHLPSRRQNDRRSDMQRRSFIRQIDSIVSDVPLAVVCGDFNCNPSEDIMPQMYNATAEAYRKGKGSYAYADVWRMYDQIFVSNQLRSQAQVFVKPYLITKTGRFKGYPAKSAPSDHLPVFIDIRLP